MPLITISAAKSWMKRTGSWPSDVWNFLSNIQFLMEQQANIQTLLTDIASNIVLKTTRIRFYTVSMLVANRQYSFAFPAHTKNFEIQITSGAAFRVSFDSGRVGPAAKRPYWSVSANSSWDKEGLDLTGVTLYFACATAGVTMEIAVGT